MRARLPGQERIHDVIIEKVYWFCQLEIQVCVFELSKNLITCQQNVFVQGYQQVVTTSSLYTFAWR